MLVQEAGHTPTKETLPSSDLHGMYITFLHMCKDFSTMGQALVRLRPSGLGFGSRGGRPQCDVLVCAMTSYKDKEK